MEMRIIRSTGLKLYGMGIFGIFLAAPLARAIQCELPGPEKDLREIAQSCEAIMDADTMDATRIKKRAFDICCEGAKAYLKKNPVPKPDPEKIKYRIKLGFAVCDELKEGPLDYEHQYCVNQMLYHISDPVVLEISEKCSPSGGRSPKKGGGSQSSETDHSPKKEVQREAEKPVDQHMDDETYSKCQRTLLGKYLDELDQKSKEVFISPQNHRHKTKR